MLLITIHSVMYELIWSSDICASNNHGYSQNKFHSGECDWLTPLRVITQSVNVIGCRIFPTSSDKVVDGIITFMMI